MNKFYLLIILLIVSLAGPSVRAQNKLVFDYDAAGNQASRQFVCVNCPPGQIYHPKKEEELLALDQEKQLNGADSSAVNRELTASPNPVEETLKVSWRVPEDIHVRELSVFSMNGTRVLTQKPSPREVKAGLSFSALPPGIYILLAVYSDGKRQTIKLAKK